MNYYSSPNPNKVDCPEDILQIKEEEVHEETNIGDKTGKGFLTQEEMRKLALEVIFYNFFQLLPISKTLNKKFIQNNQIKTSLIGNKPKVGGLSLKQNLSSLQKSPKKTLNS